MTELSKAEQLQATAQQVFDLWEMRLHQDGKTGDSFFCGATCPMERRHFRALSEHFIMYARESERMNSEALHSRVDRHVSMAAKSGFCEYAENVEKHLYDPIAEMKRLIAELVAIYENICEEIRTDPEYHAYLELADNALIVLRAWKPEPMQLVAAH